MDILPLINKILDWARDLILNHQWEAVILIGGGFYLLIKKIWDTRNKKIAIQAAHKRNKVRLDSQNAVLNRQRKKEEDHKNIGKLINLKVDRIAKYNGYYHPNGCADLLKAINDLNIKFNDEAIRTDFTIHKWSLKQQVDLHPYGEGKFPAHGMFAPAWDNFAPYDSYQHDVKKWHDEWVEFLKYANTKTM